MEISVRQTSIRPAYIKTLLSNGILLVSHLTTFDTARLAQRTRLTLDECEQILAAIKPKRPHYVLKASELMIRPFERISTSIEGLDEVLGGGVQCGQITEISGEAGAGKSNLCAQIGILVMLAKSDKGLDGDVLLIHTEGEGKLKLAIKRFNTLAASIGKENLINERLHVINSCNEFKLAEIINRLPEILSQKPTVKLIIIDSITCAFISTDENPNFGFYAKRSLRLTKIVKMLTQIAWDQRIAIIATNHVSYNFKFGENRPAMGKLWSHMCQTKIYLERNNASYDIVRFAHVTKGALNTPVVTKFRITNDLFDHLTS